MPWTSSSSSSAWGLCPASRAWTAATCGQSTTSPSRPGSGPGSSAPARPALTPPRCGGRTSAMGNASTSVGPGSPIHRSCSSVMAFSSTSSTDSSASGWMCISSSTWRAIAASATSSTATPDSLAMSMLNRIARSPTALPPFGVPGVVALVGIHDLPDQAVPDHVVAGQPGEVDVWDALEGVLHHPQAADLPLGQVDLGHVTGDDHLGAETEPGQEHFHLLGRSVLSLVQDDERVVQGPAAHVGQRRDLDRARRGKSGARGRV